MPEVDSRKTAVKVFCFTETPTRGSNIQLKYPAGNDEIYTSNVWLKQKSDLYWPLNDLYRFM